METHADVIAALRGGTKLAKALDAVGCPVDRGTVFAWKLRNRIPARYFVHVAAAARQMRVESVTVELLAKLAAAPDRRGDAPADPNSVGGAVSQITETAINQDTREKQACAVGSHPAASDPRVKPAGEQAVPPLPLQTDEAA